MTDAQRNKLKALCESYKVEFNESDYAPVFDLPTGWVAGWVGGLSQAGKTLYVGVDPDGSASS